MPVEDPSRRDFLAAAASLASAPMAQGAVAQQPVSRKFIYEEVTIASLGDRMQRGELSSSGLTQAYLERIAAIDRKGPQLRAVIETNPDAAAIARKLDAERKAGKVRGPLHGVPILLKDNIPSADRMSTSAGSIGLHGHRETDCPVTKRLRDAGVVILGKANLSEWANFRSTNSISGWSSRGGQTRNPYATERSPSGSSSGSAVGVAANLCVAAIGTETDGSIVSPSACNNIVGFKPSIGFVSRAGVIPISHSQDTVGPMARTVEDCAILMNVMASADPQDSATTGPAIPRNQDFRAFLGMRDLKGVRVGVARQYLRVNEKVDHIIDAAVVRMKELGAELIDVEMPGHGKFGDHELEIFLYEFKTGLNAWLQAHAKRETPFRNLAELIEYNERNRDRIMPLFGQNLMIRAQEKGPLTEKAYTDALAMARQRTRDEGIDQVVKQHGVAAIVAPTTSPPWLIDAVTGDSGRGGCSSMAAVAGYPHVTVPAGFITPRLPQKGLAPVGLSFFGPAFSDAKLLGIAHVFERATQHRRPPPV